MMSRATWLAPLAAFLMVPGSQAQPTESETALTEAVEKVVDWSEDGLATVLHERAIAIDPMQGVTHHDEIVQAAAMAPAGMTPGIADARVRVFDNRGLFVLEQTGPHVEQAKISMHTAGLAYHTEESGWEIVSFGNVIQPQEGSMVPPEFLEMHEAGKAALPDALATIDRSMTESNPEIMRDITREDAVLIGINPPEGGWTLLTRDEAVEIGKEYHPEGVTFELIEDEADLELVGVQVALSVRTYKAIGATQELKVHLVSLLWWNPEDRAWEIASAANAVLPLGAE